MEANWGGDCGSFFYLRRKDMEEKKFIELLKKIQDSGYIFYNTRTENQNSPSTVFYNCLKRDDLVETEIEEQLWLKSLSPREYFITKHWIKIEQEKLEQQPICEGCGNKAYKVFKKTWDDKGYETLDSVISVCHKCRVIDGQVISYKDIKEEINKEIHDNQLYKDMIKKEVENTIIKTTKDYLNNKNTKETRTILEKYTR
jgi:SOS response regulatory protein OraA/RecX